MLYDDKINKDATELAALNEFQDTLSQFKPQRHDLYSKALAKQIECETLQLIQRQLHESPTVSIAGTIFARGDGKPDRPGTCRKPGVRRQPQGKVRFTIFSAK